MSGLLAPALRRLFPSKATADMGEKVGEATNQAVDALGAAVDRHASVHAAQRSAYEAQLRETMDDLLKRLDQRAHG